MTNKKIVFIGMMGSGKTTIARLLAEKLNLAFFDMDKIFTQKFNISISEFFKEFGEEKFRNEETNILKQALVNDNFVLSCGGGVILKKENRDLIFKEDNITIFLKANPETIYNRIKNDTSRPLLMVENPKKEIEHILKKREEFYNLAKITIQTDNKTTNEITEEIFSKLCQTY